MGTSQAGPSSQQAPSSPQAPPYSQGLPPLGSKKKSILNFISQGLFASFNVGKHNAQEIRAHRQHVDEQLLKLETRQKALMAKNDIVHSPICEPLDFPPPPEFYNPWEEYGHTSWMYSAALGPFDDEGILGDDGDDDGEEEESPPPVRTPNYDD